MGRKIECCELLPLSINMFVLKPNHNNWSFGKHTEETKTKNKKNNFRAGMEWSCRTWQKCQARERKVDLKKIQKRKERPEEDVCLGGSNRNSKRNWSQTLWQDHSQEYHLLREMFFLASLFPGQEVSLFYIQECPR